jgi:hypothetical protein
MSQPIGDYALLSDCQGALPQLGIPLLLGPRRQPRLALEALWVGLPRRSRRLLRLPGYSRVTLDRAIRLAKTLGAEDRVEQWKATREQIRVAIDTNGWSQQAGAFGQSFGCDELDASNLMLLLTGFLPATDSPCVRRSTPSRRG